MPLILEPSRVDPKEFAAIAPGAKTAGARLTSPPAYWDDEISQILIREHPYIPLDRATVTFTRRDDTSGMGTGYVSIVGSPQVSIPIVIKNWELAPLDILIVQRRDTSSSSEQQSNSMDANDVMPLNEDTFRHALDTGSLGEPVPMHQQLQTGHSEDGSSLRLPFRGRTVLASVIGATEAQKQKLAAALEANRNVLIGFVHNGTGGVIDEWLSAPEPSKTAVTKIANAPIELPNAVMANLPANLESFSAKDILAADVFVSDETMKTAVAIDAIDLFRGTSARWLLFDDSTYARANLDLTGFKLAEADEDKAVAAVLEKTSTAALRLGQTLVFHTGGIFTAPCKLSRLASFNDQRSVELTLTDDLGVQHRVVLDGRVKEAMHDDARGTWVLPMATKVLALGEYQTLPVMEPGKVASALAKMVPDTLICNAGQWSLTVNNEPFVTATSGEKMAGVLNSFVSNADELMKVAHRDGSVRFASRIPETAQELVKQANRLRSLPADFKAACAELSIPLEKAVKLAASIGDPSGVDAVLGAGFLTEDNVAEFVGLADQFEQAVGKLARLLLAIRLGLPGDESATVVAMKALSRVAERLRSAGIEGTVSDASTSASAGL